MQAMEVSGDPESPPLILLEVLALFFSCVFFGFKSHLFVIFILFTSLTPSPSCLFMNLEELQRVRDKSAVWWLTAHRPAVPRLQLA